MRRSTHTRARSLVNKRAVDAVISNIILTGAVIAVSFAVLAWVQYQGSNFQQIQGGAINDDINQLKERVVFECIYYNSSSKILKVYVMNTGGIGNVSITRAYVNVNSYSPIQLKSFSGTNIKSLNQTQDGYFSISSLTLVSASYNSIKIVTWRGSSFVGNFTA